MLDGKPYALAGLFSEWRPRRGNPDPPLDTLSIVTTEANELMEPIHNRMPVILHSRDFDRWLNDYDESRPPPICCAHINQTNAHDARQQARW
jgi:putative SOS response-associated peptidase YedK